MEFAIPARRAAAILHTPIVRHSSGKRSHQAKCQPNLSNLRTCSSIPALLKHHFTSIKARTIRHYEQQGVIGCACSQLRTEDIQRG